MTKHNCTNRNPSPVSVAKYLVGASRGGWPKYRNALETEQGMYKQKDAPNIQQSNFVVLVGLSLSPIMLAQKAIYAGSIVISLDSGYRGDAEDFQPERQLIRRLLYSPTGLSTFFLGVVHNWFAF